MPGLIRLEKTNVAGEKDKNLNKNSDAKKDNLKPVTDGLKSTATNTAKKGKPAIKTPGFQSKNNDLVNAVYELIDEIRRNNKISYALFSILQREVYTVIEEADDPILSRLPPKAKDVFSYIAEQAINGKRKLLTMTIMAKFNLTQEELFQIVDIINKEIQKYGFTLRFEEEEEEY